MSAVCPVGIAASAKCRTKRDRRDANGSRTRGSRPLRLAAASRPLSWSFCRIWPRRLRCIASLGVRFTASGSAAWLRRRSGRHWVLDAWRGGGHDVARPATIRASSGEHLRTRRQTHQIKIPNLRPSPTTIRNFAQVEPHNQTDLTGRSFPTGCLSASKAQEPCYNRDR